MTFLTKVKPGAFGLLVFSLMLSTIATTAFKSATRPTVAPVSTQGNITRAAAEANDAEVSEPIESNTLTYHDYQIDIELENLARLIKAEARTRLEAGVTQEQVEGALAALANEPATPETTVRRLYLLRTLQTLKGEAPAPEVEPVAIPTVEGYRDEIGQ
jgi:hypothetical protein